MTRRWLWLLPLVASVGCFDSESGLLSCGDALCGPRQVCTHADGEPACVCRPGYTGGGCDLCASGYRRTPERECVPIPIDCEESPGICGAHGACVPAGTPAPDDDACACATGWSGRLCEACADGYQDQDYNDTCEPGCALASLHCPAPRVCDDSSGLVTCSCPEDRTGDECELCALGYRWTGRACVASCALVTLRCSTHEVCDDAGSAPRCVCRAGYAGPGCTTCAEGYSDAVRAGECLPTCAAATVSCGAHATCADDVGFAYCQCEVGWAGAACDTCAEHHEGPACELCTPPAQRIGDGPCHPSCDTAVCGAGQHCLTSSLTCGCDAGYAGPTCTECAVGFAADGAGHCVANVSSRHTLVADLTLDGDQVLAAIEPTTGAVTPLRSTAARALAFDPAARALYAHTDRGVGRLDPTTGTLTPWVGVASDSITGLTFDLATGTLLTVDAASPHELVRRDATTGARTVLGPTSFIFEALAYDSAQTRVYGASNTELYALADNGAATRVGELPLGTQGLAFAATGELYGLVETTLTGADAQVASCRDAAHKLGFSGYSVAAATAVLPPATALAVELTQQRVAGLELVALAAQGASGARTVTVRASNPDTIFCVTSRAEPITLTIPASSRFRALIVDGGTGLVEVAVEAGFAALPAPHILLGGGGRYQATPHPAVRPYTPREWQERRSPGSEAPGPVVLHRLDPATGASLSSVTLSPTATRGRALSPWAS